MLVKISSLEIIIEDVSDYAWLDDGKIFIYFNVLL